MNASNEGFDYFCLRLIALVQFRCRFGPSALVLPDLMDSFTVLFYFTIASHDPFSQRSSASPFRSPSESLSSRRLIGMSFSGALRREMFCSYNGRPPGLISFPASGILASLCSILSSRLHAISALASIALVDAICTLSGDVLHS